MGTILRTRSCPAEACERGHRRRQCGEVGRRRKAGQRPGTGRYPIAPRSRRPGMALPRSESGWTGLRRPLLERWAGVLALSRLVIEPDVPRNACSFLLSRSVKLIDRSRWPFLVTYADEWRGHTGTIYLAAGWKFDGFTKPEAVYTLNGRMVFRKRGPRTFTHSEMLAVGAVLEGRFRRRRFVLGPPYPTKARLVSAGRIAGAKTSLLAASWSTDSLMATDSGSSQLFLTSMPHMVNHG